jgi:predicted nucleic acid-binding protein
VTTATGSKVVVVDSSGWVEFLGDTPRANLFVDYLAREDRLLVPSIVVYEVCKKLLRLELRTVMERFLSHALRAHTVYLDHYLAVLAARLSLEHKLAMADAIVYATARNSNAELVTGDAHFRGLPGVTLL